MTEPDTRELLSAYIDGELGAEDRARVEAALAADASLRDELDAMRSVDSLFRKSEWTAIEAPAELEARVRAKMGSASTAPVTTPFQRKTPWRWLTPLAAAAGIVVAAGLVWQLPRDSGGRFQMADAPEPTAAQEEMHTMGLMRSEAEGIEAAPPPPSPAVALEADSAATELHEDAPGIAKEDARLDAPSRLSAPMLMRAPEALEAPAVRMVGEAAYRLHEGRWTPAGYADEPLTPLPREDARWLAFTAAEPESAMRGWPEAIVVNLDDAWYELAPDLDSIGPAPLE